MKYRFRSEQKKVIFFDVNHTLIDPEQSFHSSLLETLHDYTGRWIYDGEALDPNHILQRYNTAWNKNKTHKTKTKSLTNLELRKLCLQEALKPFPINKKHEFIAYFIQEVVANQEYHYTLKPHVKETLALLADKYKLAILSNSKKDWVTHILSKLQLSSFFPIEHVVTLQKGGYRKPHLAVFQRALRTLNIKPSQGVMVGDSWKYDIYGATKAGLDAVWIQRSHSKKISQRKVGREKIIMIREFHQLGPLFVDSSDKI